MENNVYADTMIQELEKHIPFLSSAQLQHLMDMLEYEYINRMAQNEGADD